jgi:large subunit ribosomal protein L30
VAITVGIARVDQEADVAEPNFSKVAVEGKTLRITWVKSSIGYPHDQKATIKALGLHRLHQTVEHPDNPQLRGQVYKVKHLVNVEEA